MVTIIRNYRMKIRKTENKFIFFIQYLGEKMSDFKFVCREEELNFVQEALLEKKFIIYYYFNDSGLTHYLKKLNSILNTDNEICFYVDCIKSQSIAIQIATQIISCFDKKKLSQYTKSNGEVIKKIIESLSSSIDIIPFVNAGELVSSFADAIKDTLDTDIEHLSDYKIEKAIISMLGQIEKKGKIRKVYILVDDASSLKPEGIEFVAKIMDFDVVRTLLTIPNNHIDPGMENLSKICANDYKPYELEKIFKRPNDTMIKGLFRCYEQNYNDDYLNIFNRYERNIHVIMSYIRGFHMDFMQLDKPSICILKILLILGTPLDIVTLKTIYIRNAHLPTNIVEADFNVLINKMSIQGFIARDQRDCIHLNNNIVSEKDIKITLIERLSISRDIIDTFEICKMQLTIPQLKFAVSNLDKDYNRRKSYILLLLDKQKSIGQVEQQYLDMLFYLDNKYDLIKICSMYYNLQVYDVPFLRLQQHTEFLEERECKDLLALLKERLHKDNYCEKLWDLVNSSINLDEKCLLMAVLFTALFNNGENEKCLEILHDTNNKFYYENFRPSCYYHFLLRNVSYYVENVEEGIRNYSYCLSKFKNCDPVNYNRTLSNFIGYLMKHIKNKQAKRVLNNKIDEVKSILEFNDQKYLYLNINYGIYLMLETNDDPTPYFDSILFDAGTTETPYIYAKINQALYIAQHNPIEALKCLDEIFYASICDSNVVPTKIFYKINRLLVDYMNDINNVEFLEEIKSTPLRGDEKYTKYLYSFYSYRFKNKIKYKDLDFKQCFLPGYIFYHGFDAEVLMSSLARPNLRI